MSSEEIIKIVTMIGIPIVSSLLSTMWLTNSRLVKMEAELEALRRLSDERFERIDRHVHDIRNSLQAMTLFLARKGLDNDQ